MIESSKYKLLAKRSGIAGIVILISWCVLPLYYFELFDNPITWYLMQLAQCLLFVLPIPAIVAGLWSFRGLNWKDYRQYLGYAVFGILTGLLSIAAALYIIMYAAINFD